MIGPPSMTYSSQWVPSDTHTNHRGPFATYHSSMAPPSAIVAKDDTSTMFKLGAFDGSSPRSLMLQGLGLVVVAAVLWWYAYP